MKEIKKKIPVFYIDLGEKEKEYIIKAILLNILKHDNIIFWF